MAIQDSFNLNNAINSQSYAYKCWYNYNYGNNTMGISAKDMGVITQTWNGELKNWKATALKDDNAYEIEDDDFSTAKMNGKNQAKDKTGYDGKKGGMITRGVVDGLVGTVGALSMYTAAGKAVANKLGTKLGGKLVEKSAEKVVGKAAKAAAKDAAESALKDGASKAAAKASGQAIGKTMGEETTKKSAKSVGAWSIAAPLSLATAVAYRASKPNKDAKEACDDLQDEMNNASAALGEAQGDMQSARDEVEALSDEAQVANEDTNDEIEDKKSEYDTYKASYDALMEKVNNGEQLTDDEKELLKELVPIMKQLGIDIADTQEETTDTVGEIYDEMGTYQEGYDNAAETVAEVEGLTDYAESFDSATQTMCYVEAGAQTLNAASGGQAAAQAGIAAAGSLGFNAWAWACAAMGTTATVISGFGAKEQFEWAGKVGTEIGMRKDTQNLNAVTSDIYDESIDVYEGQMDVVNDMEIEVPDDLADPDAVATELDEGAAAVLGGEGGSPETSGLGLAPQNGAEKPTNNGGTTSGSDDKDKDKDKK